MVVLWSLFLHNSFYFCGIWLVEIAVLVIGGSEGFAVEHHRPASHILGSHSADRFHNIVRVHCWQTVPHLFHGIITTMRVLAVDGMVLHATLCQIVVRADR